MLYLYIVILFLLHLIPMGNILKEITLNEIEIGLFRLDYLLHTIVFLPWMFLPYLAKRKKIRPTNKKRELSSDPSILKAWPLALWLLLGIIFAVAAEGIQYWLPYRGFNPMDMIFNVLGILIGAGLLLLVVSMASIKANRRIFDR